jgi:hypothetical protein
VQKINRSPPDTFEESLEQLKELSKVQPIYVKTLFELFSKRGIPLFIIALTLPFCQPIQLPGLSTPFGLLIAFLGFRLLLGHKALLPKFLLEKELSKELLDKALFKSLDFFQKIQAFCRPRLLFFSKNQLFFVTNSLVTVFLGLFLALPLPIPLTNLISGWALLFLQLGLLEDDGLFIAISYIVTALCIGFFVGLALIF